MSKIIRKRIDTLPNQLLKLDESNLPVITAKDYQTRIESLFEAAGGAYTHFVIYGDREHFSNIEFFTGIDPRFEEALLILSKERKPYFIVGDEGCDYVERVPYPIDMAVYHAFSLPQQPRRELSVLNKQLADAGLTKESKVGVIGWKYFDARDFDSDAAQFDLPLFIYKELAFVCGEDNLGNATNLMIDNEKGLRTNLDAKELVLAEVASTKSSRGALRVLQNLKEGISELEASKYLEIDGTPLSVYPNINFAENYYYAIASPMHDQRLKKGDVAAAGMSYRRSLCHKAGLFIDDESDLEEPRRTQAKEIFDTYFEAMKKWYETLGIGISGGDVVEETEKIMGPAVDFGIGLNLGHGIHTDEWINTPFYPGSTEKLHSGMAIQCDFTAAFQDKDIAVHAEDGVAIADEALRNEIKKIAPDSYRRIMARKDFMKDVLGIHLKDEVLPLSDMSGVVFPFLGDLSVVIACEN